MNIEEKNLNVNAVKFFIKDGDKEIARAYLYILKNDLHKEPFGFLEDVFVDENYRGQGIASKLLKNLIEKAKKLGCYKLICTSRYGKEYVHNMYLGLGFMDHGKEFRMNLK